MPKRKETIIREVMLCQGQRDFAGIIKDCDNCKQKFLCHANKISLYIKHKNSSFVFALNKEDAERYFKKGYGIRMKEIMYEQTLKEFRDFLGGE